MKKIFFTGIKGVGLAGLAILAKQAGFEVAGSDVDEEFITDEFLRKENIQIFSGFGESAINEFFTNTSRESQLLITTAAHGGLENKQVVYASSLGIPVLTYAQAVGKFMSGELLGRHIEGISVAGSHGKTTIAAFISAALTQLHFDPSYIVGTSEIFPIGAAGHYGKGKYFIVEADEYASDPKHDKLSKFLYQKPQFAIFNNIDFDHPDFFNDISDIENAFAEFSQKIHPGGILFINGDDTRLKKIQSTLKDVRVVTYGTDKSNDYYISNYKSEGQKSTFDVESSISLGSFTLSIPGYHNAKNALAVIALLVELGISIQEINKILPQFYGTKRRFEKVGITKSGAIIIDDYAHHPQEIKATLMAVSHAFPGKKIICVFQPHTFSRTKALLSEFVSSFSAVHTLVLLPTFASARNDIVDVSQEEQVMKEFEKIDKEVVQMEKNDVIQYLNPFCSSDEYVIVTMGAGDVYKIGKKLIEIE